MESNLASDRKRAYEIILIETERLKRLITELLNLFGNREFASKLAEGKIDDTLVVSADVISSLGNLAEAKDNTWRHGYGKPT